MTKRTPHNRKADPTPKQIASRAAVVRSGWSEREREKRLTWLGVVPLGPPEPVTVWTETGERACA